jgi:hypothetical protein
MDKCEKTVYFMVTKIKYSFYRMNIEVCFQSTAISFSKEEKGTAICIFSSVGLTATVQRSEVVFRWRKSWCKIYVALFVVIW